MVFNAAFCKLYCKGKLIMIIIKRYEQAKGSFVFSYYIIENDIVIEKSGYLAEDHFKLLVNTGKFNSKLIVTESVRIKKELLTLNQFSIEG